MTFEEWKAEVNQYALDEMGLTVDDFEDYVWEDEWKDEVDPKDSFYFWYEYVIWVN